MVLLEKTTDELFLAWFILWSCPWRSHGALIQAQRRQWEGAGCLGWVVLVMGPHPVGAGSAPCSSGAVLCPLGALWDAGSCVSWWCSYSVLGKLKCLNWMELKIIKGTSAITSWSFINRVQSQENCLKPKISWWWGKQMWVGKLNIKKKCRKEPFRGNPAFWGTVT